MVYRNNTGRLGCSLHQCVLRNTLAGSKTVVSTSRDDPVLSSPKQNQSCLLVLFSWRWPPESSSLEPSGRPPFHYVREYSVFAVILACVHTELAVCFIFNIEFEGGRVRAQKSDIYQ